MCLRGAILGVMETHLLKLYVELQICRGFDSYKSYKSLLRVDERLS